MSKIIDNAQRKQSHEILTAAGYVLNSGCPGPNSYLEFYTGPKGCVILQTWTEGHGCNAYANWPLGVTFDDLRHAL